MNSVGPARQNNHITGSDRVLIPYHVDVPMERMPVANIGIILITCAAFVLLGITVDGEQFSPYLNNAMTLNGWSASGLFGYMFLHADPIHLLGNMLFLWVFGNAVCAKVGNIAYPFVYVGLGVASGITHLMMDKGAVIGASGAINGIVGAYLVLYPRNEISCFYFIIFFFLYRVGTFSIASIWMVLFWFAFDIIGVFLTGSGVAYWAHVGGFAAGFILTWALLAAGVIESAEYEHTLPELVGRRN